MGTHAKIDVDKFPKQGQLAGQRVRVCFNYNTTQQLAGTVVRDDDEEPYQTIIRLDDGRTVLATECQDSHG